MVIDDIALLGTISLVNEVAHCFRASSGTTIPPTTFSKRHCKGRKYLTSEIRWAKRSDRSTARARDIDRDIGAFVTINLHSRCHDRVSLRSKFPRDC